MNSESQQQRIMVYFIEEAKDHLQTIEQGVLNLQEILVDPEAVTEMFRAAHSIKGGAAMLGVSSVQHIAHRLEDYFKILKDHTNIEVDEKLKSLLLASFDRLQELIDQLQQNFRIPDDLAAASIAEVEPVFSELGEHLQKLVEATGQVIDQEEFVESSQDQEVQPSIRDLVTVFQSDINNKLRDMLQLFKQEEQFATRQQLQDICDELSQIGREFKLSDWCELIKAASAAIANQDNSYRILAPVLIKDIKQAKDLILDQRSEEISISLQLQDLLPADVSILTESDDEINLDFLEADVSLEVEGIAESQLSDAEQLYELSDIATEEFSWVEDQRETSSTINGPEVGAQELKSLATLFENEDIDLESAWEDIESNETLIAAHSSGQALHEQEEFADLFADEEQVNQVSFSPDVSTHEDDSLAELFGTSSFGTLESNVSTVEDDNSLFPENILESSESLSELGGEYDPLNSDIQSNLGLELLTNDSEQSSATFQDLELNSNAFDDSNSYEPPQDDIFDSPLEFNGILDDEEIAGIADITTDDEVIGTDDALSDNSLLSLINDNDELGTLLLDEETRNDENFDDAFTNLNDYENLDLEERSEDSSYELAPDVSQDQDEDPSGQVVEESLSLELHELESDPFNLDLDLSMDVDEQSTQDPFAIVSEEELINIELEDSLSQFDEDNSPEISQDKEDLSFDVFALTDSLVEESDSLPFQSADTDIFMAEDSVIDSDVEVDFFSSISDQHEVPTSEDEDTSYFTENHNNLYNPQELDEARSDEQISRNALELSSNGIEQLNSEEKEDQEEFELDPLSNIQDYLFDEDSVELLKSNESPQSEFELAELGFDMEEDESEGDNFAEIEPSNYVSARDALNDYATWDEEQVSNTWDVIDENESFEPFVYVSDFDTNSDEDVSIVSSEELHEAMSSSVAIEEVLTTSNLTDENLIQSQEESSYIPAYESDIDMPQGVEEDLFMAVLDQSESVGIPDVIVTETNSELEIDELAYTNDAEPDFDDFFVNDVSESPLDGAELNGDSLDLDDSLVNLEDNIQNTSEVLSSNDLVSQEASQILEEDFADFFTVSHDGESSKEVSVEMDDLIDFFTPTGIQVEASFTDEISSLEVQSEIDEESELLNFFDVSNSESNLTIIDDLEIQDTDDTVAVVAENLTESQTLNLLGDNEDLGLNNFFNSIEQSDSDDILQLDQLDWVEEEQSGINFESVSEPRNVDASALIEDEQFLQDQADLENFSTSDEVEQIESYSNDLDLAGIFEETKNTDELAEPLDNLDLVEQDAAIDQYVLPTDFVEAELSELEDPFVETADEDMQSAPTQVTSTSELIDFFSISESDLGDTSGISVVETNDNLTETTEDLDLVDFFAEVNSSDGLQQFEENEPETEDNIFDSHDLSPISVLSDLETSESNSGIDESDLSVLMGTIESPVNEEVDEIDHLVNLDDQNLLDDIEQSNDNILDLEDHPSMVSNTENLVDLINAQESSEQLLEDFNLDEEYELVVDSNVINIESDDSLRELAIKEFVDDVDLENFFSTPVSESNASKSSDAYISDEINLADFLANSNEEPSSNVIEITTAKSVESSDDDTSYENTANLENLFTDPIPSINVQSDPSVTSEADNFITNLPIEDEDFELSDEFSNENIEDNIAEIGDYSWAETTNTGDFFDSNEEDIPVELLEERSDEKVVSPSASTTIDNLVDFFEGDDQPEFLGDEDTAIAENTFLQVSPLGQLPNSSPSQPNISAVNTSAQTYPDTLLSRDLDSMTEFDELEAMLDDPSGSLSPSYEVSNHQSQLTDSSNDSNFDELEALLEDIPSGNVSAQNVTQNFQSNVKADRASQETVAKKNDEFGDLEALLKETYGNDGVHVNTKTTKQRTPDKRKQNKIIQQVMKVDVKHLDSLNNLVGELVVNRNLLEQNEERLQQFITNLLHQVQQLSDVSQRMRDQYDRSLLENSLLATRRPNFTSGLSLEERLSANNESTDNVDSEFDALEMDRFSSFHSLSQEIIELIVRVRESADDIDFVVGETEQVSRQLGVITTQLQDDLKQSRMVPFAQLADRLPRAVRDLALQEGKQVDIEIFGRETLIDKAVLDELNTPMNHLITNAIAHGIEDPATRQASGKPARGKITVRAYHQGNQTVISINDDGGGINVEKVKQSAVGKGMLTSAEASKYTENDTYELLFEPGFSTKVQADQRSGRGMGLDIVKTDLSEIRGTIHTESAINKGTTFTIRLPLTLSISKAMFCISDRTRIAFPVDGFEDMMEVPQSQIQLNSKGQPCLPWRDTILPFQPLANLLSYSRHISRSNIYGKQDDDVISIIILRNEGNYLALQVDQFLGESEIVIKQLEGPIPKPAGIAGATVLGDGRVMAIANVLELFDIASGRLRPLVSPTQPIAAPEEVPNDPTVLIVDDSITVRELLSLTFAKVGYRVEQARDGQDAWEKLRAGLPCNLIFCDIEMPRMDGLELLSRLQKDENLSKIPIAMLTSRGADRHRQTAVQLGASGYFTKPYLEEELLSASQRMLKGEVLVSNK